MEKEGKKERIEGVIGGDGEIKDIRTAKEIKTYLCEIKTGDASFERNQKKI